MAAELPPEYLHQDLLLANVKEEPLENESKSSTFCYETVTKEEVILDDQVEHADGDPEADGSPPAEISSSRPFKCSECNRMFNSVGRLNGCVRRHNAIKVGLYKCRVCGKCLATRQDQTRHEAVHKKEQNQSLLPALKQGQSEDDFPKKWDCKLDIVEKVLKEEQNEEVDKANSTEILKDGNGLFKCSGSAKSLSEPVSEHLKDVSKERPFKCLECHKTFDQVASAQRCELRCNALKLERYKCNTCGKCFISRFNLARHEEGHRNATQHKSSISSEADKLQANESIISDRPFKCSECNQSFYKQHRANRCEKKHLALRLGLYECKFCQKRVGTSSTLKIHELAHKRKTEPEENHPKLFACDLCEKRFTYKQSIKKHMRTHHSGELRFTCHRCNVKFETMPALLTHIKRHDWDETKLKYIAKLVKEDDGTYLCTICNKKLAHHKPAKFHVFRHMNLIEGLYECKTCKLKCGDTTEYKKHIQNHKKPEEVPKTSYQNSMSEKTDESKESDALNENFRYDAMIKEELIIDDDKGGESEEDEREEDSRNSLEDHQPMEVGASNQQVEESRESLEGQSDSTEDEETIHLKDTGRLKKDHIGQHLPKNTNQFKCDACQKVFKKIFHLKRHRKVHEKSEVPLECMQCNEDFDNKHSLYMHYKDHAMGIVKRKYSELLAEDETDYRCLLCEKTFKKRNIVRAHLERHINLIDGIYQCKICGLRLGANFHYQKHVQTHKTRSNQRAPRRMIHGVYTDYDSSSTVACEKSNLHLHCKTCNVFFNNKTNLNVHLWTSKLRIIRTKNAVAARV